MKTPHQVLNHIFQKMIIQLQIIFGILIVHQVQN